MLRRDGLAAASLLYCAGHLSSLMAGDCDGLPSMIVQLLSNSDQQCSILDQIFFIFAMLLRSHKAVILFCKADLTDLRDTYLIFQCDIGATLVACRL